MLSSNNNESLTGDDDEDMPGDAESANVGEERNDNNNDVNSREARSNEDGSRRPRREPKPHRNHNGG